MIQVNSRLQSILKANESKPIMRVEAYDTAFSVPSHGFFVRYYSGCPEYNQNDPGPGSLKRTQFEDRINNDYSNGIPAALSNYVGFSFNASGVGTGSPYMVSWSGYFYSDQAGAYSFSTLGYGATRVYVGNSWNDILSGTPQTTGLSNRCNWNLDSSKGTYFSGVVTLSTGWYPIKIDYGFQGGYLSGINQCYVSAFYTAPGGKETLLTASKVTPSGAFLQPQYLNDVMSMTEDTDENGCEYTFEVPIIGGESYIWNLSRESFGLLKPNNLVKFYTGYATESGYIQTNGYTENLQDCTDYIQRFVGFIDTVSIDQQSDTLTATVKCRDFSKKLLNALNENYPNKASYSRDILNRVDGAGKFNIEEYLPNAYDKWYLIDAIKDLVVKAGIDPVYFRDDLISIGNYFRLEHNLSWPIEDYIDQDGVLHKDGDPFLFKYTYGDKVYDLINKIVELIGYKFKFDENGNVFIKDPRYTKRIECFETNVGTKSVVYYGGQYTPFYDSDCSNRIFMCNVSGNLNYNDTFIDIGSLGYWPINGNGNDSIGLNNLITTGTLQYGSYAGRTYVSGFTTGNYYKLPDSIVSRLSSTNKFTFQTYVYGTLPLMYEWPLFTIDESYNAETQLKIYNNKVSFLSNKAEHETPQYVLQSGKWNHIALEFDAGHIALYVNNTGYYYGSNNYTIGRYGQIDGMYIGTDAVFKDGWHNWGGLKLSDIRILSSSTGGSYPTGVYPTIDSSTIIPNTGTLVSFSGVGVSLIYSTPLTGGYITANIRQDGIGPIVYTTGLELPHEISSDNKWFITNTLPYDGYTLEVIPSGNTLFKFEAIEYYEKNIFEPEYTFRANEDIATISMELTDEDLRNEVIVIGQQQSDKTYMYGRSIDLDSMTNPQAFNFAGGKRSFVLYEPRLMNQKRIDWLSQSLLARYRKNKRTMTIGCVGNPAIQEGDCIGVVSNKIGINTDTNIFANSSGLYNEDVLDVFYVQKINSKIENSKYVSNITISSLPPIESWKSYLPITSTILSGYVARNGHIFSNFSLLTKNSSDGLSYDGLSDAPCFMSFDSFVDLDRLWVFVDDKSLESIANSSRNVHQDMEHNGYINRYFVNNGDYVNIGDPLWEEQLNVLGSLWAWTKYSKNAGVVNGKVPVAYLDGGDRNVSFATQGPNFYGCKGVLGNWVLYIDTGRDVSVEDGYFKNTSIYKFETNDQGILGNIKNYTWDTEKLIYSGVEIDANLVWLHNGGGELNGTITVPTAMEENMKGNFIGENSSEKRRINGTYPIGIWGIGTMDDGTEFGTELGLWHPNQTTDVVTFNGYRYPALSIKNRKLDYKIEIKRDSNSNWEPYVERMKVRKTCSIRVSTNIEISLQLVNCYQKYGVAEKYISTDYETNWKWRNCNIRNVSYNNKVKKIGTTKAQIIQLAEQFSIDTTAPKSYYTLNDGNWYATEERAKSATRVAAWIQRQFVNPYDELGVGGYDGGTDLRCKENSWYIQTKLNIYNSLTEGFENTIYLSLDVWETKS